MAGLLKTWKVSGITTEGAKLSEPLYRLGDLLGDVDRFTNKSARERAEILKIGHQYLVMKDALDRHLRSGGRGSDDDAAKFLVMFAAVAMGMNGAGWDWQAVRHLSQGLYTSLDETPAAFRATNIPLIEAISDKIRALDSAHSGQSKPPITLWNGEKKPPYRLPAGVFVTLGQDGPTRISTDEFFSGRKVVLFGVPGAFTPTCDARHLPGYIAHASAMKARGVDLVACLAVNDAFVMKAWARASGIQDEVIMLSDGNADYVRALGLELDASDFSMGIRSKRFAMIVVDGVASHVNVEGPGEFRVSAAEHVLEQL